MNILEEQRKPTLFIDLGRHQLVKRGVGRELIDERNKRAADFKQALSGSDILHEAALGVGNIEKLRQPVHVVPTLIEHNQQFAVGKHGSRRVALQQVFHVLRNTGAERAVFADALPERMQEIRGILVLEHEINFVDENIGVPLALAVARDAVENTVQHDQHTRALEVLSQLVNVIAHHMIVGVDVGLMGKGVHVADGVHLNIHREIVRLRLLLFEKLLIEVLQGRRFAAVISLLVIAVSRSGAAVDDGFLLCAEMSVLDQQLTERHEEFRFQDNRVCAVAVIGVHIHRIDVVVAGGGQHDCLAVHRLDQRGIFSLRVNENIVRVRVCQNQPDKFILADKGLAGTGHAENHSVAVEKIPAVDDDQIFADGILTEIHAVGVTDFLCAEGRENGKAVGGQGANRVNFSYPIRQRGVERVHLLVFQPRQTGRAGSGKNRGGIAVKLLFAVGGMHNGNHHQHHSLIVGGDVVEKILCLRALLHHVKGNHGGEVVVLVLPALPVGDIRINAKQLVFDFLNRLVHRQGNDVDGKHEIPVEFAEIGDQLIIDTVGIILQIEDASEPIPEFEIIGEEFKAVGDNRVAEIMSAPHEFPHIETKLRFLSRMKEIVQESETLLRVQFLTSRADLLELREKRSEHAGKIQTRFFDASLTRRNGDVFLLHDGIGALGFVEQHPVVFAAVGIQSVVPHIQKNPAGEIIHVHAAVVDGNLAGRAHVEGIEDFRVLRGHHRLFLVTRGGIVYVVKTEHLAVLVLADKENAVVPDTLDRNHVLHRFGGDKLLPVLRLNGLKGFQHGSSTPLSDDFRCPLCTSRSKDFWACQSVLSE